MKEVRENERKTHKRNEMEKGWYRFGDCSASPMDKWQNPDRADAMNCEYHYRKHTIGSIAAGFYCTFNRISTPCLLSTLNRVYHS